MRFTPGQQSWFNTRKINVIHQIKKIKEKNHSLNRKPTDKFQHLLVTKTLSKLETEENFLNLIKGIYEKLTS